jgi:hypothetical protein
MRLRGEGSAEPERLRNICINNVTIFWPCVKTGFFFSFEEDMHCIGYCPAESNSLKFNETNCAFYRKDFRSLIKYA